jgi:hypothetical protein
LVRVAASELVIKDHAATARRRRLKGLQIIMGAARTAVEAQQWQLARFLSLTDDPIPYFVATEFDESFFACDF